MRNKNTVRLLLIFTILALFITSSVIYLVIQDDEKDTSIEEPDDYEEIISQDNYVYPDEEIINDWHAVSSKNITFKYPDYVSVTEAKDEDCNKYTQGEKFCFLVTRESNGDRLIIKAENNDVGIDGSGLITEEMFNNSKVISIEDDRLLIRGGKFIDSTNKTTIPVQEIIEIYEPKNLDMVGSVMGEFKTWIRINNIGYTITYIFPSGVINDSTVKLFDQIVATLKIDETVNPFE